MPTTLNNSSYLPALVFSLLLAPFSSESLAESKQARIALIIANSAYDNSAPLSGVGADADTMVKALKQVNFDVTVKENLTRPEMENALKRFKQVLSKAGGDAIGLLYYAGHGGSDREGTDNFLIPVDAPSIDASDIRATGVSVRSIQRDLQELRQQDVHPAAIIVVIDACRTAGPGDGRGSQAGGKMPISRMVMTDEPASGYLFAFSTSKSRPASDDGQYAKALAKWIVRDGLTIPQVFEEVQRDVARSGQLPIYQPFIVAPICLVSCEKGGAFAQNKALLGTAQKDAEEAVARIQALRAEELCKRGWDAVVELVSSGKEQATRGNFDTAGQTYTEVKQRAAAIETHLLFVDRAAASKVRRAALMAAQQRQQYDRRKSSLDNHYLPLAKGAPKAESFKGDLAEVEALEAEAEALMGSGQYEDAMDKLADATNLARKIWSEASRSPRTFTPIPKMERSRGLDASSLQGQQQMAILRRTGLLCD